MNAMLRNLVAVVSVLLLAACGTTRLVLVDDSYGFEHLREQRGMHLATPRAVLSREPAKDGKGVDFSFVLDVRCDNDSAEPWEVRRDGFECTSDRCEGFALRLGTTGSVLVSVPPRSHARVLVPIVIHSANDNLHEFEHVPVDVVFRVERQAAGGEEKIVLLHKRLLVGEFDVGWQVGRFAGLLSSALVVVFLL